MKGIQKFKNIHKGKDIWVVGSGGSLEYVEPSFFDNKIVVGVNMAYKHWHVDYTVVMHLWLIDEALEAGQTVITSEYECCYPERGRLETEKYTDKEVYMYKHLRQDYMIMHYDWFDQEDALVIGGTTAINAMSFAYHLGASTIMLAGIDGCSVNGMTHYSGYKKEGKTYDHGQINVIRNDYHKLVVEYRDFLKEEGVPVYSLSPFIGMRNELQTIE